MKVVINACHGGFGLSHAAFEALIARGWTVTEYTSEGMMADPTADLTKRSGIHDLDAALDRLSGTPYYWGKWSSGSQELRTHPDIIAVVEELGKEACGKHAKLKVIEIPFDGPEGWEIDEYDGWEKVVETHASWS